MQGFGTVQGRTADGLRSARRRREIAGACAVIAAIAASALAPALAAGQADPGGNEDADLSGAPAGKLFGFSGISHVGVPDPNTAATYIANLGGNVSRTAIHWQGIEPTRDRYRTASLDRYGQLYDAMRLRNIRPIFMVQFAPAWAREPGPAQDCGVSDSCHYPPATAMLGEWREFIGDLVRRFPEAAIEVWNEPNYIGQWQSGVDPEGYAELLEAADQAARAVDPATMVLAGGLGAAPKPNSLGPGAFLRRAYAATPSLAGHTDAINFHVYPGADGLGAGSSFAAAFAEVRAARAAAEDLETPLLVTEVGGTTSGPNGLSQEGQAQLLQAVSRKILTMDDTLGALIYTLTDRTHLAEHDPERGFGVLVATPGLLGTTQIETKRSYCTLNATAPLPDVECAPETELDAAPPPVSRQTDPTFRFSSSDGGIRGFECSLDGTAFRACGTPYRLNDVPVGHHTFAVRARDVLNRVDLYPARANFAVVAPPPPPPPPPPPRLAVSVRPAKAKLRAGGRRKRFRVKVGAPGTARPVTGVSVCMRSKAALVREKLPYCRQATAIPTGGQAKLAFFVGLERRAAGRKLKLRFTAAAPGAERAKATSRVRGKRR